MTPRADLHPLLVRQLRKSGGEALDVELLLNLVSDAYCENDRDRSRSMHANVVMAEELEGALATLELQNLRFRAALDNMDQGLCLFDAEARIAVCNRRFLQIYGFSEEQLLTGRTLDEMLQASPAIAMAGTMEQRRLNDEHGNRAGNQVKEIDWPGDRTLTFGHCHTDDGGFLLTVSDITDSKRASEQISYLARHDSLTELPNRLLLRERMKEIVRNSGRNETCAVICLDLDRFKAVNDTLGHPVGDALLVAVAKRLRTLVRSNDVVARLGGDEFAVVLRQVRRRQAVEHFAQRVIRSLSRKFNIKGHDILIGASLGVAIEPVAGLEPNEALRRADLALYAAKSDGRSTFRFYTPEMHETAKARLQLEIDLRQALKNREFEVLYQPQLNLATRRLSTVEALVRWNSPSRGVVLPMEFIPVCEEIGLIDELGCLVLETAIQAGLGWPDTTSVAINLSPVQFQSGRLVDIIRCALRKTGFPATRLEFEVTENLMLEDTGRVLDQIKDIKQLGCRISLDDFGVGYSSLSYIRQYPFDKIKIDKSFVRDLADRSDSMAIVRAVTGLCESLGLESTAEGVETQQQLEILRHKNVDSVQGYLISRPRPAEQIETLIALVNSAAASPWSEQRRRA